MRARKVLTRIAVILAVIVTSACGFLFSKGPPPGHENMNYFSCTESDIGPAIDFVWSGLNIAGAIIVAGDETIQDREFTIGVGAFWGFFSGAAGFVGMSRSKACREAKGLLADRLARAQTPLPAIVPRPSDSGWRQIRQWAGTGNWTTESFPIATSEWRVTWTATNPGHGASMYVSIEDGSGQQVTRGAMQGGAGSGQVHVTAGPGQYYLEIVAVNLNWDITVQERL